VVSVGAGIRGHKKGIMADQSGIEWTDATWNPVTGCSKVSTGCAHCYAEVLARRFNKDWKPWTKANAAHNVQCHQERLGLPLHWKKPRKIFVNSMSDLFHEQVPDSFLIDAFQVMVRSEQHTFQILTKRPERMAKWLLEWKPKWKFFPPKNIWLGVSVENQQAAEERIGWLMSAPAHKRFLSCEPLLGPVNLGRWLEFAGCDTDLGVGNPGIDWVIVGGESGRNARPMNPKWVHSLRDQCEAVKVPFFFKQWGEWAPAEAMANVPATFKHKPMDWDGAKVYCVGKGLAGRVLDGRTWDEVPA